MNFLSLTFYLIYIIFKINGITSKSVKICYSSSGPVKNLNCQVNQIIKLTTAILGHSTGYENDGKTCPRSDSDCL